MRIGGYYVVSKLVHNQLPGFSQQMNYQATLSNNNNCHYQCTRYKLFMPQKIIDSLSSKLLKVDNMQCCKLHNHITTTITR
jgi:hypothetical protein